MGDVVDDDGVTWTADKIGDLNRSANAHRTQFTMKLNGARMEATNAKDNPGASNLHNLQVAYDKLQEQYEKYMVKRTKLIEVDRAKSKDHEAKIVEVDDLFTAARAHILEGINACQPTNVARATAAAAAAAGAGGGGAKRFKPNEAAKPPKLETTTSYAEFKDWKERFEFYYSTSMMDSLETKDQRRYLRACMSGTLWTRIKDRVDEKDIFGDDSCMNELDEEFKILQPVFVRQQTLFSYRQGKNQLFSDYLAKLEELSADAQLANLTPDNILVFIALCNAREGELRTKMNRLRDPTVKDLRREAHAFEMSNKAEKRIKAESEAHATAAAAGQFGRQGRQGRYRGGGRSGANFRGRSQSRGPREGQNNNQNKPRGDRRCYACGDTNHFRKDCQHNKTVCLKCKKTGHLQQMCSSQPKKQTASAPNSPPPSRASSPDRAAETSNYVFYTARCRASRPTGASRRTPRARVKFRQGQTSFDYDVLPDSGTSRTVVSGNEARRRGLKIEKRGCERLFNASGDEMKVIGTCKLCMLYGGDGNEIEVDALVSDDLENDILLSWHDMIEAKMLPQNFPCVVQTIVAKPALAKTATCAACHEKPIDLTTAKQQFMEEFPGVFANTLGKRRLKGPPMKIHLREDVEIIPKRVTTTRQVPLHMQEEAEKTVKKLLDNDIIVQVPVNEPTDWVSHGHFVRKPDGSARLVTDYVDLNKYVRRPIHTFPTQQEVVQRVKPDSKVFLVVDAASGYFQVLMDEESSKLTTFLLSSGAYRYKVAPMGLSASSDEWCRRSDQVIQGLEGVDKLVDDILVQAPSADLLMERARKLFKRCEDHGMTLSEKKMQIGSSVKFAGYIVSETGIGKDPEKVSAIKNFPRPTDVSSLRSFLGLVNQLSGFAPDLTQQAKHLRELIQKNVAFVWQKIHDEEFKSICETLASDIYVKPFDPALKTKLLTDAARKYGLGYILLQEEEESDDGKAKNRLVMCGSKSLTDTQSNYSTTELEALGILWSVEKCDFYLRGLQGFTVVTDHRPLVGTFKKPLHQMVNARLQRFRERLSPYVFDVEWIAGKKHMIADALSRAPFFPSEECDTSDDGDFVRLCHAMSADSKAPLSADPKLTPLLTAARAPAYQRLVQAVRSGKISDEFKPFRDVWDQLSLFDAGEDTLVLLDTRRIVVPMAAQKEILTKLHIPHTGLVKTRVAARELYYWPTMNSAIKKLVESCPVCQMYRPSQAGEPQQWKFATEPMQQLGIDLCQARGKDYVVLVDRFSGFPWMKQLRTTTTEAMLRELNALFLDFGYPKTVRTDGGPQFLSEFESYCKEKGITHEKSSPYFPQSNGLAEAAVKSTKKLLLKVLEAGENYKEALSAFRNMPRADGFSPAQMFFGRRCRGELPALAETDVDQDEAASRRRATAEKHMERYAGRRELPTLKEGERVFVQDAQSKLWRITGTIKSTRESGRSYEVETDGGSTLVRSRKFLRPTGADSSADLDAEEDSSDCESEEKDTEQLRRSTREKRSPVRFTPG